MLSNYVILYSYQRKVIKICYFIEILEIFEKLDFVMSLRKISKNRFFEEFSKVDSDVSESYF